MRRYVVVLLACLLAIGVLPADAAKKKKPKLPLQAVSCALSITESIRVGNSLFNCPDEGLVVGAPGITIDLNGHTIDGDDVNGAGDDSGVANAAGHADVRVTNGTIRGFEIAVRTTTGDRARVDKITALGNTDGITGDGVDGQLVGNTVSGNGDQGIRWTGNDVLISKNRVSDNDVGISLPANGARITKNRVDFNHRLGMAVNGSNLSISKNSMQGNGDGTTIGAGIDIQGGTGIALAKNTSSNNSLSGFEVNGANEVTFAKNKAHRNGRHGFDMISGDDINLVKNVANSNGFFNGVDNATGRGFNVEGATNVTGNKNKAKGNDDDTVQCEPAPICA